MAGLASYARRLLRIFPVDDRYRSSVSGEAEEEGTMPGVRNWGRDGITADALSYTARREAVGPGEFGPPRGVEGGLPPLVPPPHAVLYMTVHQQ